MGDYWLSDLIVKILHSYYMSDAIVMWDIRSAYWTVEWLRQPKYTNSSTTATSCLWTVMLKVWTFVFCQFTSSARDVMWRTMYVKWRESKLNEPLQFSENDHVGFLSHRGRIVSTECAAFSMPVPPPQHILLNAKQHIVCYMNCGCKSFRINNK